MQGKGSRAPSWGVRNVTEPGVRNVTEPARVSHPHRRPSPRRPLLVPSTEPWTDYEPKLLVERIAFWFGANLGTKEFGVNPLPSH